MILHGFLLVCARAHAEALPLLYGINTFSVGESGTVRLRAATEGEPWIKRSSFRYGRVTSPPVPINTPPRWVGWFTSRKPRQFVGHSGCFSQSSIRSIWREMEYREDYWEAIRKLDKTGQIYDFLR